MEGKVEAKSNGVSCSSKSKQSTSDLISLEVLDTLALEVSHEQRNIIMQENITSALEGGCEPGWFLILVSIKIRLFFVILCRFS